MKTIQSFTQCVTKYEERDSYGPGWIGGSAPDMVSTTDGRTKVNGEIKPLVVKAFNARTNVMVGSTVSGEDGTWRLNMIDPKQRYQVVFQNDEYVDDNGDLYNSFVQDFISGVPVDQVTTPGIGVIPKPIPRFAMGLQGVIIRSTIQGRPTVETMTPNIGAVNVGMQRDNLSINPISDPAGSYICKVKYQGHESTIDVPYTVVPQSTFKQARMTFSIHPEMRDGKAVVIRKIDGLYDDSQPSSEQPSLITGIPASFIGTSVDFSPEVPMCFIGGGAIGDIGFDMDDSFTAAPSSPKVVDFWVSVREYPPEGKIASLLMFGFDRNIAPANAYKFCYINSSGELFWEDRGTGTSVYDRRIERIGNVVIPLNTWTHVQYQQDETPEKNSQIFINGKFEHNWRGLGMVRNPWTNPMVGETSGYTSARAFFLMSSGKWAHPDIANIVWLEGYMAKVQFHVGFKGTHTNFDVTELRKQRVSRLKKSVITMPVQGTDPFKNHDENVFEPTPRGTGYVAHPTDGLVFDGEGGVSFQAPWCNYSQCIEFFFNVDSRDPEQCLLTITDGANDGGLDNGGLRVHVGGGGIQAEFAKTLDSRGGYPDSDALFIDGNGFIAGGSWVHCALTFDAMTGTARLFYQGVLMGEKSYSTPIVKVPNRITQNDPYYMTIGYGRQKTDKYGTLGFRRMSGKVRGIRLTQGSPVYTAAFTPPTLAEMTADQTPCQWAK